MFQQHVYAKEENITVIAAFLKGNMSVLGGCIISDFACVVLGYLA
jgi:hypothetical protein